MLPSSVLKDFEVETKHLFVEIHFADSTVKLIRVILLGERKHVEPEAMPFISPEFSTMVEQMRDTKIRFFGDMEISRQTSFQWAGTEKQII